jgi:hypothetical protein
MQSCEQKGGGRACSRLCGLINKGRVFLTEKLVDDLPEAADPLRCASVESIPNIVDQQVLWQIANGLNWGVGVAAVKKITNQASLAELSANHNVPDQTRIAAIEAITDQKLLRETMWPQSAGGLNGWEARKASEGAERVTEASIAGMDDSNLDILKAIVDGRIVDGHSMVVGNSRAMAMVRFATLNPRIEQAFPHLKVIFEDQTTVQTYQNASNPYRDLEAVGRQTFSIRILYDGPGMAVSAGCDTEFPNEFKGRGQGEDFFDCAIPDEKLVGLLEDLLTKASFSNQDLEAFVTSDSPTLKEAAQVRLVDLFSSR